MKIIKLNLEWGKYDGKDKQFKDFPQKEVITIGREDFNDIVFSNDFVSARHGTIYRVKGTMYYEDHSLNGTEILDKGGKVVVPDLNNNRIQLIKGMVIVFKQDNVRVFRIKVLGFSE